jgi:hypothetical protein
VLFLPTGRTNMWTHTVSFFPAPHAASHPRRARVVTWRSSSVGGYVETDWDARAAGCRKGVGNPSILEASFPPTPIGSRLPFACSLACAATGGSRRGASGRPCRVRVRRVVCILLLLALCGQHRMAAGGTMAALFPLRFGRHLTACRFLFRHADLCFIRAHWCQFLLIWAISVLVVDLPSLVAVITTPTASLLLAEAYGRQDPGLDAFLERRLSRESVPLG